MFNDCPKMMIDSSANGSVSGSDSRIVMGCSHDSNCAARIRYMNTIDNRNAMRKFCAARPSSLERPAKRVLYPGPMFNDSAARVIAAMAGVCETPGSRPAKTVT